MFRSAGDGWSVNASDSKECAGVSCSTCVEFRAECNTGMAPLVHGLDHTIMGVAESFYFRAKCNAHSPAEINKENQIRNSFGAFCRLSVVTGNLPPSLATLHIQTTQSDMQSLALGRAPNVGDSSAACAEERMQKLHTPPQTPFPRVDIRSAIHALSTCCLPGFGDEEKQPRILRCGSYGTVTHELLTIAMLHYHR